MSSLKIGFHTGPGGSGLKKEWLQMMDSLGKPFCVMSADAMPYDAQEILRSSSVPHIVVYRSSTDGQDDGNHYDVPNYDIDPIDAAHEQWAITIAKLPPELDPELTWIATENEIDKNRSQWFNIYTMEICSLALENGYKHVSWNWSAGEPEPENWIQMSDALSLIAANPERLAVGLHEYSLLPNAIWTYKDNGNILPFDTTPPPIDQMHLIGRFHQLVSACHQIGIQIPTMIITEWGWTLNDAPDVTLANEHMVSVGEFYAQYPQLKGAATWYLGAKWNNLWKIVETYVRDEPWRSTEYEGEIVPPIEPPSNGCKGLPRVQYRRVVNVVKQGESIDTIKKILDSVWPQTITNSYDDAGIGDLDSKTAALWNLKESEKQTFIDWFNENYPGTIVQFKQTETEPEPPVEPPIPPPTNQRALVGLHASADGGDLFGGATEYQEFKSLQPEVVKILSSTSAKAINRLFHDNPTNQWWIIRAFLHWGGRTINPTQFYTWTKDDVARSVNALRYKGVDPSKIIIELHNEPNLVDEGLTHSWNDGSQFGQWLEEVRLLYKQDFVSPLMYPGLSPGGDAYDGNGNLVRLGSDEFLRKSKWVDTEYTACHAYWSPASGFSMQSAVYHVARQYDIAGSGKMWITEASNNTRPPLPLPSTTEYANEYNSFLYMIARYVHGVTYFVSSASNEFFWPECWVVNQNSKLIAQALRNLLQ